MISSVQNWIDNPNANFGWIIIGGESSKGSAKRFDAKGTNAPKLTITYQPSLSISTFEPLDKINLFPNPSSNYIRVSGLTEKESYIIYNILGTEISKGNVSNDEKIDIEDYAKGIYLLKLKNRSILKFIVE